MTSIVQISDTHFGTEQPSVVQALEDHVREHRADLLVFSGDITQRARRGQFASAAAFVRRVQADGVGETLVIPGNHDIPLYNLFARLFTPSLCRRGWVVLSPITSMSSFSNTGSSSSPKCRR